MKLFCEFLFLAVFFAVFKLYGIYPAIASAIILYGLQLVFMSVKNKKVDRTQLLTFLAVFILGGTSLIFQNDLFFKWKPSVIYWVLALAIVMGQIIRRKPSLESLLAKHLTLPPRVWYQLDYVWATFFAGLGFVNIAVAYQFTTNTWVYFKLFGTMGAFIVFILLQMIWLSRYAKSS